MLWVFGIAFGLIEAAVVVYLRALLGVSGASLFPMLQHLSPLQRHALGVEAAREGATLVLMLAPAWLFHRRPFLRFLGYMIVFGVWDLSYYGFLWVFLGWPASLFTYDLLFMLPTAWVAPVVCPVLVSLSLIAFAMIYLALARHRPVRSPRLRDWVAPVLGGALVLAAFMRDAGYYLAGGLPPRFSWWLFTVGFAVALASGAYYLYDFAREPARSGW